MSARGFTKYLIVAVIAFGSGSATQAFAAGKTLALEALGGADAPGVRAALVFLANPGEYARSKGIAKVSVPTKGIYCVKLSKNSKIKDSRKTVPVATGGAEGTYNINTIALVSTSDSKCTGGKRWLAVRTLEFVTLNGDWEETDNVSFNLIVP